jgi:hypothetical protein
LRTAGGNPKFIRGISKTRENYYSPAGGNPKRKTQGNLAAGYRYIYR